MNNIFDEIQLKSEEKLDYLFWQIEQNYQK